MSYFDAHCVCDYDPPDWYRVRRIKAARKPHKCFECGALIAAGQPYEYTCGQWDRSGIDSFSTCMLCVDLRNWAKISVPCFCWTHGGLLDEVEEMVSEVRHDVPGLFFEYGRRMVAIRRARWKE
jgi:hypothetical protein